ncbi:MAG: F0F1 ATP synthase subunit A [Actinomycetota bacterium]
MELDVNELFFWDPIALEGTALAVNRVVLLMFIAAIACMTFFVIGARRSALVPKGIQNLVEMAYLFVRNNIAIDVIGPEGIKYANYLAALFFFIFFSNLLEIVPGINFPVTSRMALPAMLALITYFVFIVVGISKHGLRYFKDIAFPPGVPTWVYFLLTPIEIFSTFIVRPFTLAVRLFANMVAGHVLLTIFFLFTHDFLVHNIGPMSPFGVVTLLVAAALILFELLVISLQAYIFTMLTASYIGEAIAGHGEHEEEEHSTAEPVTETEGLATASASH